MKILVVADEESEFLWDHYDASLFEEVDFIISAGDLKSKYLSFLTTMTRKRVYFVHGNHDTAYEDDPPLGCDTIEDTIVVQNGIRILGLGGSYRYKPGDLQYNEKEMRRRIRKLNVMIKQFGGIDIVVSHAPIKDYGDGADLCHRGFNAFKELIDKYSPAYFIHGHQHLNYGHKASRIQHIDNTTIINGYNYYFFDYIGKTDPFLDQSLIGRIFNSFIFYNKYMGNPVMKEYRKYKRYLKNNNIRFY